MPDTVLAPGRHGAFTRTAAVAAFGRHRVREAVERGEWQSPWSGVYVEAARASDPLTLAAAAVELAGGDGLVTGPTATHLHGCRALAPTPIHLLVPYEHWLRSRPGLVVHNGHVDDRDRSVLQDLPVLGLERALGDLLSGSRTSDPLAVTDEALRMIDPDRREAFRAAIADRIARRLDPRGTRRGAQILGLATGRAESPAESWLLWRVVDAGFPLPEVNWSLLGIDGREVYRLDLSWPDLRIAIEYHGFAAHVDRAEADDERVADLRRRGWIVIEVRAEDLRSPGRYERELEIAFRRRGVDVSRRRPGALQGRRHREPRRRP
jgi:hypothetical protein